MDIEKKPFNKSNVLRKIGEMNFTMIFPNIRHDKYVHTGDIDEGISYLASVLEQKGIHFNFIRILKPINEIELLDKVKQTNPDIIGYSSISPTFKYIKQWAPIIKKEFGVLSIYGGIHPSLDPEGSLSVEGIDAICIGEGEESLAELCTKIKEGKPFTDTKNFWFKQYGEIVKNPVRPLKHNLDHLPHPKIEIFDYANSFLYRHGWIMVKLSRGCVFNCNYCCNHILRQIYPNPKNYVRYYSVDFALDYIKNYLNKFPNIKALYFIDDILTQNRKWFGEFILPYKRNIGLPFCCNDRFDLLNKETLEKLRYGGCFRVYVGVESGNRDIRYNVLNRKMSNELINQTFENCHRLGIQVYTFNMLGRPHETMAQALDTVKINTSPYISRPFSVIFIPFPSTKLHKLCLDEGLLSKNNADTIPDTLMEETILYLKSPLI